MALGSTWKLSLLAASIPIAPLWAKGDMVMVEIKGGTLTSPIRITYPKIQEFNIWAGPGVNDATLKNGKGFVIDWQAGIVSRPRPRSNSRARRRWRRHVRGNWRPRMLSD